MELDLQNSELEEVAAKQNYSGLIDYDVYVMSAKEKVFYVLLAASVLFAIGYIFYHHIIGALILTPLALLYPKRKTKDIIEKRKSELNLQFKDLLYSISASLTAGKSVETAFKEALNDLCICTRTLTRIYKHEYFGETRMHINQIIVDKEYKRKGIGKRLLEEAEKKAKELGIKVIDLFVSEKNAEAVNFYEKTGFVTERRYLKKIL